MIYLCDANVLSEPTKPSPNLGVIAWLRENESGLVINPIVAGEIEIGILVMPTGRKRNQLNDWFQAVVKKFPQVELDANTAATWAKIVARLKKTGRAMPIKDSLIAASAMQHHLTVATRNVVDYQHAGVQVINPFAD